MTENDKNIEYYWSLAPKRYKYLERLELQKKSMEGLPTHVFSLHVWLRLSENEEEDLQQLPLSFDAVRELKLHSSPCFSNFAP